MSRIKIDSLFAHTACLTPCLPSSFAAFRRCYLAVLTVLATTRGAFGITTGLASQLLGLVAGAGLLFCETDSGEEGRSEELVARTAGADWVTDGCSGFCETDC